MKNPSTHSLISPSTFIIAEAGVNHNGSIDTAKKMIDVASEAGANAVKFQTFKAEKLVCREAPKAKYQNKTIGGSISQFEMLKRLELSHASHRILIKHCSKKGITFLSTPFDLESIDFLNELAVKIFKIPSGEITNLPYLRKIGSLKKKVLMSSGMSDMDEIATAIDILINAGTKRENITILHANTEYPTPMKDVNLSAMLSIKKEFRVNVGYSDHTPGIEVPVAAVALGASVIEKHFTLDKRMKGPDHNASLEPLELRAMIKAIRNIEKALGDGIKRPSASELKNKAVVRKSIVAAKNIKKGEIFLIKNLAVKRPGFGISPMEWDRVVGQKARRDFAQDEIIEL